LAADHDVAQRDALAIREARKHKLNINLSVLPKDYVWAQLGLLTIPESSRTILNSMLGHLRRVPVSARHKNAFTSLADCIEKCSSPYNVFGTRATDLVHWQGWSNREIKGLNALLMHSNFEGAASHSLMLDFQRKCAFRSALIEYDRCSKPKLVRMTKKLWYEQLKEKDVSTFLDAPPILRGTGFEKNETGVERFLIASEPLHTYVMKYALANLDKRYKWDPICDLGYSANDEIRRQLQRVRLHAHVSSNCGGALGSDFADFNSRHTLESLSRDYLLIMEVGKLEMVASNCSAEAIQDWCRCCKYISDAMLNSWVRFENEDFYTRVRVGLYSGMFDTNGGNERRQYSESKRACWEAETLGLNLWPGFGAFLRMDLRGDDSISFFRSVWRMAIYLALFSSSGRPMAPIKQESSVTNGCEYLRKKENSCGVRGYLLRSLGSLITNPFENCDRQDLTARLCGLTQQLQTLMRRCGNPMPIEMLRKCLLTWWSVNTVVEDNVVVRNSLPYDVMCAPEVEGGLGCVLWPLDLVLKHVESKIPHVRLMAPVVARNSVSRGSTDLIWNITSKVTAVTVADEEFKKLISRLHESLCVGSITEKERTDCYNLYSSALHDFIKNVRSNPLSKVAPLRLNSALRLEPATTPFVWFSSPCMGKSSTAAPQWFVDMDSFRSSERLAGGEMSHLPQLLENLVSMFSQGIRATTVTVLHSTLAHVLDDLRASGVQWGVLVAEPGSRFFSRCSVNSPRERVYEREGRVTQYGSQLELIDRELMSLAAAHNKACCYHINDAIRLGSDIVCLPLDLDEMRLNECVQTIIQEITQLAEQEGSSQAKTWLKPSSLTSLRTLDAIKLVAESVNLPWAELTVHLLRSEVNPDNNKHSVGILVLYEEYGLEIIEVLEECFTPSPLCLGSALGPLLSSAMRNSAVNWNFRLLSDGGPAGMRDRSRLCYYAMLVAGSWLACRSNLPQIAAY
jgi:hypothetical protein